MSPVVLLALFFCLAPATATAQEEIHVELGSAMRYLANATDPGLGMSWTGAGYDDSSWPVGTYGVGYEDSFPGASGLLGTTVPGPGSTRSIYSRSVFNVIDVGTVNSVLLGADFDDAYAAWINGVEVFRSSQLPSAPSPLTWDTFPGDHESSNATEPDYELVDVTSAAMPALQSGANVLSVAVWNRGTSSSDLVLVPFLATNRELSLTRGPYLQSGSEDSVIVRWRTSIPIDGQVMYGTQQGNLTLAETDPALTTEHSVTLTGLSADTTYYYSVGTNSQTLAGDDTAHFFVTSPLAGVSKPTRIWVLGDSGTGTAGAAAVRDAYYGYAGGEHTDLWLMLGDNAYTNGTQSEYQTSVFEMYPEMLRKSVLWPTLGNHDAATANSTTQSGPYYDIFSLPSAAESGGLASGTEAYYAFDYGNIHFVVLDSHGTSRDIGSTMLLWLDQDLANTTQDWIIAFWHHPPYSKGGHDSDTELRLIEMRENVLPILDSHGVDLTLTGHSHNYERSYLIDGAYDTPTPDLPTLLGLGQIVDPGDGRESGDGPYDKLVLGPDPHSGTVHTVTGSSGQVSFSGTFDHPVMVSQFNVLGSLVLDVVGKRLDSRFLDSNGVVRDHFTITKGSCPNDPDDDIDGDEICGDIDNCPGIANAGQEDDDGDGTGNVCDSCPDDVDDDLDSDGICGDVDNCPGASNAGQEDSDGDGAGDECDVCPLDAMNDEDADGRCGEVDNCPVTNNPSQSDVDSDGTGDICDACPADPFNDLDKDGVCGDVDNCVLQPNADQTDTDQDGKGDVCDGDDDDADGVINDIDCAPQAPGIGSLPTPIGSTLRASGTTPTLLSWERTPQGQLNNVYRGATTSPFNGTNTNCIDPGTPDGNSTDFVNPGSGVLFFYLVTSVNVCAESHAGLSTALVVRQPDPSCNVSTSSDVDGDSIPDVEDNCPTIANGGLSDLDKDFLGDACDNCPAVFNPEQADLDKDGTGNACEGADADSDGVPDFLDNCPSTANSDQIDADEDGDGNPCDVCAFDSDDDADGDGECGDTDNCPAISNSGQEDADSDGSGDLCDACPTDTDKQDPGFCGCGVGDDDADGDAVFDCLDPCIDADGDGYGSAGGGGGGCIDDDCDDESNLVNPGAHELCGDAVDNDCDGNTDDDGVGSGLWYLDGDGDGYGDASSPITACVQPLGAVLDDTDCDDTLAAINPGTLWFDDDDGDGFGDAGSSTLSCEPPPGTVLDSNDCDDQSDITFPGSAWFDSATDCMRDDDGDGYGDASPTGTVVAGNDCDDSDDVLNPDTTWFADTDSDGFGDIGVTTNQCLAPSNHVLNNMDCDDTSASAGDTFPGAAPNDGLGSCMKDSDGDDWGDESPPAGVAIGSDCNDADPLVTPDNIWYFDFDDDGFGDINSPLTRCTQPSGFVTDSTDCDDLDANNYPTNAELCDGQDNDCDTLVDDDDADATGQSTWYLDSDGDSFGDASSFQDACAAPANHVADNTDCDDSEAANYPGNTETCDGIDNDCDTLVDDADTGVTGESTWYLDSDGDSFGDASSFQDACAAPANHVADSTDCDDSEAANYPGNTETCDGIDNDCDTLVDDADTGVTGESTWYLDSDGDSFGDASSFQDACAAPANHVADNTDCDDSEAANYPGNTEVCDGIDNDCDTLVDDADTGVTGETTWYLDSDGDSFGDASSFQDACAAPANHVADNTDCDDSEAANYPGNTEVCDGIDNDCDTLVDDADTGVTGETTWYLDSDGDSFGDASSFQDACAAPANHVADSTDCDDSEAANYPGNTETCDGIDNDCDGLIDDADTGVTGETTWYLDSDGDSFGDSSSFQDACAAPANHVADSTDCDDSEAANYPGNTETCDGIDNDCDGLIDDADTGVTGETTWYLDSDGDSFGDASSFQDACAAPANHVADSSDCDDSEAANYPGNTETCDGIDNDCDTLIDDADTGVTGGTTWYLDSDGDGFGDASSFQDACVAPANHVADNTDCDDSEAANYPGNAEICDGIDNDCDSLVDDDDSSVTGQITWYRDMDRDGYGDASRPRVSCSAPNHHVADNTDCDDSEAANYPGNTETCDGIDNDCDTLIDDADTGVTGQTTWYLDSDSDGFGDASSFQDACAAPASHVADSTDCDDSQAANYPGNTETCDGIDNDCDALIDDADTGVTGETTWYLDSDGDGFGDASSFQDACVAPANHVADNTDCDDSEAANYPGNTETCDGIDNDCDTLIDDADTGVTGQTTWYLDSDSDGFGDASSFQDACVAPANHVADNTDCDDSEAANYPGNTETCDGIDNDCDTLIDDADTGVTGETTWHLDSDGDGFGDASSFQDACAAPANHVADNTDCDDSEAANYPGNTETCDGVDNDCDTLIDDADTGVTGQTTWNLDSDGDGFGDASSFQDACVAPANHVADNTDCDDSEAANYPGNTETCDGIDNDCDALIDDADTGVTGETTWYLDSDGDGFGDASSFQDACSAPANHVADNTDCDDSEAANYPGNTETCDGIDNDCDGLVDDADTGVTGETTWYLDSDGDGFGDASSFQDACVAPANHVADNTDCDDSEAANYPGNTETCDGVDNDCDTLIDDADTGVTGETTWYLDGDGDGFGDASSFQDACAAPANHVADNTDCDDSEAANYPGNTETCDGIDNDCDTLIDDADTGVTGETTWYLDSDGDGFGDASSFQDACVAPANHVADNTDCDDSEAANYPGNTETCDGVDNDCDTLIDDADTGVTGETTWYLDSDGDSFGDASSFQDACAAPANHVADNTDCDDSEAANYPGNTEVCDGIDNDCDGLVDDDDPGMTGPATWYLDADGDGFGDSANSQLACSAPANHVADSTDCDDSEAANYPGNTETCDGIDNDCDGLVDDADTGVTGETTWYLDSDGDGFGDASSFQDACVAPANHVADNTDCDDSEAANYPGNTETCDGVDNDCDTLIDDADTGVTGETTWYLDSDGDSFGDASSFQDACAAPANHVADNTDCDDSEAANYPGNTEVCDGIDNDCDGLVDDDDPGMTGPATWYLDADGDGFGDSANSQLACSAPANHVADSTDCDDSEAANYPGNTETCDGIDNDCDGLVDDADTGVTGETTWYLDSDGDGFGDASSFQDACVAPANHVADNTDCDDSEAANYPGNTETCDGVDNDCDTLIDDADTGVTGETTWYLDSDGDSFGDASSFQDACAAPANHVADNTDCDDSEAANYPGNTEVCDGIDNDCDGLVDDDDPGMTGPATWYLDADGDGFGDSANSQLACSAPANHVADSTDCDDSEAANYPGNTETCDGIDNDCDGLVDDADTGVTGETTWYLDSDGDSFGDASSFQDACAAPANHVADSTDCDDSEAANYPGNTETCDGIDNDCDGLIDDADTGVTGETTWYLDSDGDSFGDASSFQDACAAPANHVADSTDCDDSEAANYPGNTETCDGIDNDCDGLIDDADTGVTGETTWYLDSDGDSFGDASSFQDACVAPANHVADSTDCDDSEAANYPGNTETCDGVDNDCDTLIDDADTGVTGETTWYLDSDGDSFGDASSFQDACAAPANHVADSTDCDDSEAANYPGNTEVCDGIDNDCDGLIDDADTGVTGETTWYLDSDGDSFGDASSFQDACAAPANHVADNTDCDDSEAANYPGNTEVCDGIDNDCDGLIDDADTGVTGESTWYLDSDGDSFGDASSFQDACAAPANHVADNTDCDDSEAANYPGNTETCDGIDNDCDTLVDDADTGVTGETTWYLDSDGDSFGDSSSSQDACAAPANHVADNTDCDDSEAANYPGNTETCDGIDNDCDTLVDDADTGVTGETTWYLDSDGDSFGDASSFQDACAAPANHVADNTDCDDSEAANYPGNTETCDGIDNDCDTLVDDADTGVTGETTWYLDSDGDSFGDASSFQDACAAPANHVADSTDCDDSEAANYPGNTETCDGIDNDCDTLVDDADTGVTGETTWYLDSDGDSFGDASSFQDACAAPANHVADSTDCDDSEAANYPGNTETCDGIDNDCDTLVDDADTGVTGETTWYLDSDGDSFGDASSFQDACAAPANHVADNTDCEDSEAANYPGNTETCDGIDNDCDGLIDDADTGVTGETTWYLDSDGDSFGDASSFQDACAAPANHVADNTDCDDSEAANYPGNTETCDGIDNDCDTLVDDADTGVTGESTWYLDSDGDSFGDASSFQDACAAPANHVADNTDCDDSEAANYPGNTETCDGIDNDCDGLIDDADTGVTGETTWYLDSDGDSFGDASSFQDACAAPANHVADNTDCDDSEAANYPGNTEVCDGIDNDCDTLVDDADTGVTGETTWYLDSDGDSFGDASSFQDACAAPANHVADSTDCDDSEAANYPGNTETCDGIDNDCDTLVDDADTGVTGETTWYLDSDGDSFGDASSFQDACAAPANHVADNTDCDDSEAANYPGNTETCDGIDNDCDTLVDDADTGVTGETTWYLDSDGDSFGDASSFQDACAAPANHVADSTDCDDSEAANYPGNTETCDGIDNDCDGLIDDADTGVTGETTWYLDSDGDSFGDASSFQDACAAPANHVADNTDCDDSEAANYPGNTETCDGIDNDCDTLVDDADSGVTGETTWYLDSDGDSFGDASSFQDACAAPANHVADSTDCDDSEAANYPGNTEVCDGIDNDCDGLIDDADTGVTGETTWYLDSDGDSFGDASSFQDACAAPANHVADSTDCDDSEAANYPGNTEVCDGIDNDCDGLIDDADTGVTGESTWYLDSDGDSFGDASSFQDACAAPANHVADNTDCDDSEAANYPGNTETCDGIDNDCDTLVDDADTGVTGETTWYLDSDGDSFGDASSFQDACAAPANHVADSTDCDDSEAANYPGNTEVCDGIDNDCDGLIDDADTGVTGETTWYLDSDGDSFGDASSFQDACAAPANHVADSTDCDDSEAANYPGNTETCDGIDNDCDTLVDDADTGVTGETTWYLDSDGDSFGDASSFQDACAAPANHVADNTDCDDSEAANYPGNTETCDGIDNDCDTLVDDADTGVTGESTWYLDSDGDSFGDASSFQDACAAPANHVADNTDCDDSEAANYPGNTETCDGIDNDCDTLVDDADTGVTGETTWYLDSDGDSFGDASSFQDACAAPANHVADSTDCDDSEAANYPGNTEVCDGIDNDCDGLIDDADTGVTGETTWYLDSDGDSFGDASSFQDACAAPANHVADNTDCDDSEAANYPGNTETCDGIDNDCDTLVDDADTGVTGETTWYLDSDGDSFGDASSFQDACAAPANHVADNTDCDDSEAANYPGNTEVCDGIDNDCDGLIDDADTGVTGETTWYLDSDGDSFGDASSFQDACAAPANHVADNTDCDDSEAANYPGNTETCDGIDNDCDTLVDDADTGVTGETTWYLDSDGDSFGDVSSFQDACAAPANHVADNTDCDDSEAANYPGNTETCDGIDNDCDTLVDDADTGVTGETTWYLDSDGDSFGDASSFQDACAAPANHVADNTDCDDSEAANYPGNTETCDGIDNDCDTLIDDADTGVTGETTWYLDSDGDSFGDASSFQDACAAPANHVADNTDCDDSEAANYPGNTETCDGIDNDCDTLIDDADTGVTGETTWYLDSDGDSFGDASSFQDACAAPANHVADNTDCDDSEAANYPGNTETCDGIDNDCDTLVDDADTGVTGETTWYLDSDGDSFGDASSFQDACAAPANHVADNTDCDDSEAANYPGNTEACDGIDNDCDGLIDDADTGVTGETTWYLDSDGDSFGDASSFQDACAAPANHVADNTDCDDSEAANYPGNTEVCDGIDNDCDGLIDDADTGVTGETTWYLDSDGDSFGDASSFQDACAAPANHVADNTDCDDSEAANYPGNTEVCDGIDNDCDGLIDDADTGVTGESTWYLDSDGDSFGDASSFQDACAAPANHVADNTDCDDSEAANYPGNTETCDGIDNDCDTLVDDADTGVTGESTWYLDSDGDSFGDASSFQDACAAPANHVADSTDCDDSEAANYPGNTETCDGIDNDCDTLVDDADTGVTGETTWYLDSDGDSFGDASSFQDACAAPANHVADNTDCDDSEADNYPGNTETCDGIDNDCDTLVDDADTGVTGETTWYLDSDGDSFGDASNFQDACAAPANHVADSTDCDDSEADNYPGNTETCDGIDNDCDTLVDDADTGVTGETTWYLDSDGDSFGDASSFQDACAAPANHVADSTDCDDSEAANYPGNTETCDGIDNDCDTLVDDADTGVTGETTWYLDSDGDSFGDASSFQDACAAPANHVADNTDCQDDEAANYPGNTETCDGIDNDCDTLVDDADTGVTGETTWYLDSDGDSFGDASSFQDACAAPANHVADSTDCDDSEAANYPGNTETCDGIDNDCDTLVDDADTGVTGETTWYLDSDGDSFGDASSFQDACAAPANHVADSTDCDDSEAANYPGNTETCDGIDNDCDGLIDDADTGVTGETTWYLDSDGDSFGDASSFQDACAAPANHVADNTDCDDSEAANYPGNTETCDGIDNDCDTLIDDADTGVTGETTWYLDSDGDSFGDASSFQDACAAPANHVADNTDCDDSEAANYPGNTETCDGIDNDCDTLVDDADTGVTGETTWYLDSDGDSFGDASSFQDACAAPANHVADNTDCDDSEAANYPGNTETCDGIDNDCDGLIDDADTGVTGETTWYLDSDGDSFGDASSFQDACAAPANHVADNTDCDDSEAANYPGNTEVCDGIDNDCDGLIDDADTGVTGESTWYLDSDGDSFGDASSFQDACAAPANHVADNTDCDDSEAANYPGNTETCDGIDNDCDTLVDDADTGVTGETTWYLDSDGDSFGDASSFQDACAAPANHVADNTDCDDSEAANYPGNTEVCDGIDNDCDGLIDDADTGVTGETTWYLDSDGDSFGDASSFQDACAAPANHVADSTDCDDSEAANYPGNTETCDGIDNDCDTLVDDADTGVTGETTWYLDSDGDSFGDASSFQDACAAPANHVADNTDCDDSEAANYPGNTETCDGIDNDCDTLVDDADTGVTGETTWYLDSDGDSFGDASSFQDACAAPANHVADSTDCDDSEAANYPGNTETCDGIDNDCDTLVDDADTGVTGETTWYLDSDGDSFGDASSFQDACAAPANHVADNTDCDDSEAANYPGNTETCDGIDNDCDTLVDDADTGVTGETTWYLDSDGDSFGDASSFQDACAAPANHVADNTDCDDSEAANYPGNTETCDGIDNDCDTLVDDADTGVTGETTWYLDSDGDSFGDASSFQDACAAPANHVSDNTDCDDSEAANYPGNTETCDGIDNDCDTLVDDADTGVTGETTWYLDSDGDSFGDASSFQDACAAPANHVADNTDCDDSEAANYPGNTETCDGIDNDCDTLVDDADTGVTGETTWYLDSDGDSFGDASSFQDACAAPANHVADNTDCDDSEAANYPGNTETCDGIDNDCDTLVDDADTGVTGETTWYLDSDGDSFGDSSSSQDACAAPANHVASDTDCDDTSGTASDTFPGAAPNDSETLCMKDSDGDDWGDLTPPAGVSVGSDCDDDDNGVHSGC